MTKSEEPPMKLHTIATMVLVTLLVTAGAATAAPGNAPENPEADDADHESNDATENEPEPDENASDNATAAIDENVGALEDTAPDPDLPENASENASAAIDQAGESNENAAVTDGDVSAANAQGPGESLPEQMPDHVTDLHDLIRQFADGDLDGPLGHAISSLR